MTKWTIKTSEDFNRKFKKLDKAIQVQIRRWIKNHLLNVDDPTIFGKALQGNMVGYWRYRIGNYRIIAKIKKKELILIFIDVGHRSDIYDR